ncbi:DC-STAMP domain-containing protein 2-like [Diorhabda carinulata]|uniref:DC-STAMP domain-containing protein 2-like n=1 Tax=Diorhabda carinulata TaxID=1163345 RepID=UPI0025A15B48|nr:DC-STAMP domain-containing protein 2-like [Diorhabda carinulata]
MAFVRLLLTSQRLQSYKNALIEEKQEAIKYETTKRRRFKFAYVGIKIQQRLKQLRRRIGYCCCCKKFCFNLKHSGSVQNYVFKSIVGFFGGLFLTYILFMFFIFQLNLTFSTATIICSILGCILVNGLAFSSKVRCVVLLTLPHFFSERGRQLLVAYALILVVSGPVKNILNNLGILSESLACGQEQLKSIVRQIVEVIKKPFYALKDAIKKVIETVKKIIKKIKEILIKIKRIVMAILRVIKAAFMFLAKIINICNKELGTPFERCSRVFDNAIADCNAKLGSFFSWMCSITYIVKSVCYLVKIFDFVCMIVDFFKDSIIGVVVRKIKGFIRHIRTMFYVRIRFSHSYHFESKASKSISVISKEILEEIRERTRVLSTVFNFFSSTASLFFIFMIVKVIIYRYRFLTSDSFDNKFITKDFFKIDMKRAKINRETVLPLNSRERKIYVNIKSTKLTDVEKKKLKKAVTTLATINMKAAIYIGIDYCLYWILNLISYYGRFQSKVQAPNIPTPHISGKGLLADLLRSIVLAFQPMGLQIEVDTVPCLPTPLPPDLDRYIQIATLLMLCWLLTLFEPYGLRFRTFIMCYYHPLRGKQRAIWLYNNILRKRTSFLKFARRQLRRTVLSDKTVEKVKISEFLAANFRCFTMCLDKQQLACLLCGKIFRENDTEKPIRCQTPNCPGLYCEECFADLRNLCTVCLSPIDYGDLSDLSEEKDSSEEEIPPIRERKIKDGKRKKTKRCISAFKICSRKRETLEEEPLLPITAQDKQKRGFFTRIFCREQKKNSAHIEDFSLYKQKSKSHVSKLSQVELNEEEEDNVEEYSSKEELEGADMEVVNLLENSDTETDSGQVTGTDTSTDYSYSYQYSKDKNGIDPLEIPSRDVEKQSIPDYASMDSFRQGIDQYKQEFTSDEENVSLVSNGNDTDVEENEELQRLLVGTDSSKISTSDGTLDNTSAQKSFTELTSTEKVEERIDIGTTISGDTMARLRQNQHIEFIGVKNTDMEKSKIKRKRKKKPKNDDSICSCLDSEDAIRYLEKPSAAVIRKSTTFTSTQRERRPNRKRRLCECRQKMCKCNISLSSDEPNSSDSFPFKSSTDLSSSLHHKREENYEEFEMKEKEERHKSTQVRQKPRKPNMLKMFMKKIRPKYKIQKEK